MKISSPKAIRARLSDYAGRPHNEISNGDRGAVIGAIEGALIDSAPENVPVAELRYIVFGFCFTEGNELFEPMKSGDLTDGMFFALKKWIGFKKQGDDWLQRAEFQWECKHVYTLAETVYNLTAATGEGALTMMDWEQSWTENQMEIEDGGMVQSAIGYMGGVAQDAPPPPDYYGKPVSPSDNHRDAPYKPKELQPEEGWIDWI